MIISFGNPVLCSIVTSRVPQMIMKSQLRPPRVPGSMSVQTLVRAGRRGTPRTRALAP
jgi:hypothetical protein